MHVGVVLATVINPILVPLAAVLSYSWIVSVAAGVLRHKMVRMPGAALTTVVACPVMLR
jgi:hypothetical protein